MKQSFYVPDCAKELFPGSDIVRKYTFKTTDTREDYALSAKANYLLADDCADSREESALFRKEDCFGCLSPHETAA